MGFHQLVASMSGDEPPRATTPPVSSVLLEPAAWVQTWSNRPAQRTEVGLRLLSQTEIEVARAEASKRAWSLHPEDGDLEGRIECYNDAIVRLMVAKIMTTAEDGAKPFLDMPDDQVFLHMTAEACALIFEAYERLMVMTGPTQAEATDEEIVALSRVLAAGDVRGGRARRLLKLLHDELNGDSPIDHD